MLPMDIDTTIQNINFEKNVLSDSYTKLLNGSKHTAMMTRSL